MLAQYLKFLTEDPETESVGGFAIDSFPTKANKRPLPVVYPETFDPDEIENIDESLEDNDVTPDIRLVKFDKNFYQSLPDKKEISYRKYGEYYTILYNGEKAGIVGFIAESKHRFKHIGFAQIILHSKFRGKNIVKTSYDLLIKKHKDVKILYATILNNNIASQKAHIKAGFERLPESRQQELISLDWLDKDESRYVKFF